MEIEISDETAKRLEEHKWNGDTWDDVIEFLLNEYTYHNG